MPDLDSYMLIEKEDDEDIIVAVCVECHDEHYPHAGWFYEGNEGYSDCLWKCYKCGKVIHDPEDEETD